jgi:uncharacterized protein YqeY
MAPPGATLASLTSVDAEAKNNAADASKAVRNGADAADWVVVDNLPDLVPVSHDEIDVLETYLGALLDELLAGSHGSK